MHPDTLKALKQSITKWRKIVKGTGLDAGDMNCALCKRFIAEPNCFGCPVSRKIGVGGCQRTPYERFREVAEIGTSPRYPGAVCRAKTKRAKAAAQREVKFLESLLP